MPNFMHLTTVLNIPGPKEMTFGLDFESDGGISESELDLANAAAVAKWNTGAQPMTPFFAAQIALVRVSSFVFEVVPNSGEQPPFKKQLVLGPRVQTANIAGTGTGDPLPAQVSLVCSLKTPVSTRRTRGRIYLPPPLRADVAVDGRITAARADAIETGVADYVAAIEAAPVGFDFTNVIVSTQGAEIFTEVTSYVVKRRVDTQRRRLSRVIDQPT